MMAISRMQQPRQMYGLGSFVKKLTRKVTRPFTKVASKIVPKEIAGIMRLAAPFLGPIAGPAAYLLGTAKQTGRISPMDLALTLAPYTKFKGGTGIGQFKPTGYGDMGSGQSLRNILLRGEDSLGEVSEYMLRENDAGIPKVVYRDRPDILAPMSVDKYQEAISGANPIFGKLGTKTDKFLFGGKELQFTDGTPITKASIEARGLTGKDIPFKDYVNAETSGIFGKGGDMFKFGGDQSIFDTKAGQTLFGKKKDDGTFGPSFLKIGSTGISLASYIKDSKTPEEAGTKLAEATGNPEDYERGYQLFSQLTPGIFDIREEFRLPSANGGLMRTNYAMGSNDDDKPVLPEDPTKPINPFGPKPIKPLGDMKMAEFDIKDYIEEFERVFPEMKNKRGTEEYMDMLEDYFRGLAAKEAEGIMMAKEGGRANLALGTKPTPEESGLGGLPIEADMRYTGGFMPYGAKEKADDVPARLSKNEFVFTADAVRAAGGGSVNEGAKKMYATMKQLEKKPEAKGMIA